MSDEGPRLATAAELPAVADLVDRVFGFERGGMAARRPFTYDPDAPDHHAVVLEDGEVVSTAAAVPETLAVGDGRVRCWGIGGVATDPRERGEGHMSSLLEFWLDRMNEAGVPLSELAGDRQRYNRFGWENAGEELTYRLTRRSVRVESVVDRDVAGDVTVYDGRDRQVEAIRAIHDADRLGVARDAARTRTVFGQRGLETLLYADETGDVTAYLSVTPEGDAVVEEFGGDERGIEALLAHFVRAHGADEVTGHLPPGHPRSRLFGRLSAGWQRHPHRMLNVRDLPAVFSGFEEQLSARWRRVRDRAGRENHAFAGGGEVTLGIEGDDAGARLSFGRDGVDVGPTDLPPDVELDRLAMTRTLFGSSQYRRDLERQYPALAAVLPLRFYVWRSEWV